MPEIKPSLTKQDIICAETPAPPAALVVFGASGDLTHRKILPSLFQLFRQNLLNEHFYLLGCGRKTLSDPQFRQAARQSIRRAAGKVSAKELNVFINKLYYIAGDYSDPLFYDDIKTMLIELNKTCEVDNAVVFYLAVPPLLYTAIVDNLGSAKLSCGGWPDFKGRAMLVVEKPFGRDLQTAVELDRRIHRCFDESQIYRIDHYLGKETVQNILMFRFANTIFEPVWNSNYIDSIQITMAESLGVEHRADYYDNTGALRDMFQNHLLSILALVAMEPPASFEAEHIRDEKIKLLRSVRPFESETLNNFIVRGQYGPGRINGKDVPGYLAEPGIDPNSKTETCVAAKLFVDNRRWNDVPFYLRTGKRLARKNSEIVINFRKVPHSMFESAGIEDVPPNTLIFQVQPQEGISLGFQAKRPGSKICMGTLNMNFNYRDVFGVDMPEAYQRLLLDCMLGDQTLFTRQDSVEMTWQLLAPVLQAWEADPAPPYQYPAGSESFLAADVLIASDDHSWHNPK